MLITLFSFAMGHTFAIGCCYESKSEVTERVEKSNCSHHKSPSQKSESHSHKGKKSHKVCKVYCCSNYINTVKLFEFHQAFLFSLEQIQFESISPINGSDVLLRPPIIFF